jgi:adenosine kinase
MLSHCVKYVLQEKSVVYIGCVGKDKYADTLRSESERQGVRVEYRIDEEQPTGRCGVVITGSNRSLCTDLAAANCYKLEHLKQPEIWSLVEQAKVYYIGGYHLTVCPPAIMALAEEAASKDKIFILNLSAPFIPQFIKDPLDATSPYWDYLLGNETEAEAWAKSHGLPDASTVQDIAKALVTLPKKNEKRKRYVVITQGTEPTVVAEQAPDGKVIINEYPVHAISKEQINDTNGAG